MSDQGKKSEDEKPSPAAAILLALVGPWGIGQFYFGQTKRAVWWLLFSNAALVMLAFAVAPLGGVLGYGTVFALLLVSLLVGWAASLFDALRVPEARRVRARKLAVFGFWLAGVVLSSGLRFVVRGYALEAFRIPSGSMQPTVLVGDHIMVDKLAFRTHPPKRGEAIVFRQPEHPEQDFVKRVIAVSGDTFEVKQGHPWLNGWEVPHCSIGTATLPEAEDPGCSGTLELEFLEGEAYLVFFDGRRTGEPKLGPYLVAPGEVWVLGDNRFNSFDSPSWFGGRGGGLPLADVKGLGLFRWYSAVDWSSRYGTPLAAPLLPSSMATLGPGLEKCLASRPPREKTLPPSAARASNR
jgi:signal peptidase I